MNETFDYPHLYNDYNNIYELPTRMGVKFAILHPKSTLIPYFQTLNQLLLAGF